MNTHQVEPESHARAPAGRHDGDGQRPRLNGKHRLLTWSRATFAGGDVIYHEGRMTDKVYSLESGIVKEVAHLADGRTRTVGLHGPGAVLGLEIPATDPIPHSHTAIAVTRVTGRCASVAQLRYIRRAHPEICLDLIERHCERLDRARRWITEFNGDTTTSRIARAIKYLKELQPVHGHEYVELLTCQEMGEMVGVSTESASRVLAKFKRMAVLRPVEAASSSRLYRLDTEAISNLAN